MDENSKEIKEFWENRTLKPNFLWADLEDLNFKLISNYIDKDSIVLDLGAGNGSLTNKIAKEAMKVVAVDYVPIVKTIKASNVETIVSDISKYQDKNHYDVILLFGVANYLSDPKIVYEFAAEHLNDNGIFLVKHQCGVDKDISIKSEIDGDKYIANYRHWKKELKDLTDAGFEVEMIDPYPEECNKWKDTFFKMFICK